MYIIYVNNTLPLALAVHEISRHFWAAYGKIISTASEDKALILSLYIIDIYLSGLLARGQNAWSQNGGNTRVIVNGVNR